MQETIGKLVIQAAMMLWPLVVKYHPKWAKVPNDLIPYGNWLVALLTGLAVAVPAAQPIGLVPATGAVALVLLVGTRFGVWSGIGLSAVMVGCWAVLFAPPPAYAGGFGFMTAWLSPVLMAGWESVKLALIYKVFGQPGLEKGLGWKNNAK